MSEDCLKLTTYFGERDRSRGRFLADELIDLYAEHDIATSLLLRGAEGFGLRHHLRTDRLLTLSEDLPLLSVAIDRPDRIQPLLAPLQRLKRNGLITLERARMLADDPDPQAALATAAGEELKLTIYVGRRERARRQPAFVAVCELLHALGVSGATVLLGVDGTLHAARTRARFFATNADVPVMITSVMPRDRLVHVLPGLRSLSARPRITLERARICKRDGQVLRPPETLPATDANGRVLWQKLTVYSSQHLSAKGPPAHSEIVRRLRDAGNSGATNLRGIWGYYGDHPPHGDKALQLRRHAPVVTIAVDAPDRIAKAFAIIDELTPDYGLVTSEVIPALLAISSTERRGNLRLADASPGGVG